MQTPRRLPIGAEPQRAGGTHVRVWAPASQAVAVELENDAATFPLQPEPGGYFSAAIDSLSTGARYWLRLDGDRRLPDPASRFQPDGPHGPSSVVDPSDFAWSDGDWTGPALERPIVYEMHIGTFTTDGTWLSAVDRLPELAELGVSLLEVLPIAAFPGEFGWGYDGVFPFATSHQYGTPDDFRTFVNRAHELGLGVILDVVYNHLGPDGAVLRQFSPDYFAHTVTEWGDAFNFDAAGSAGVREFVLSNARYWIEEFHLDGLRLDAIQALHDNSTPHIVADIARVTREAAAGRRVWIVGEDEPQEAALLRDTGDAHTGLDALWNDDFHHTAMVALTGRREAYYTDYFGSPQEFVSAARRGFLYQGQWYSWQSNGRGHTTQGLSPDRFVSFLQNHDQVANSGAGQRVHQLASPGRYRALTSLLLLGPWIPMLFQGEEWGASSPFLYFADHRADLAAAVREGRRTFLWQFPSLRHALMLNQIPDPSARETFERCKLRRDERTHDNPHLALHRDLIALRRNTAVLRACAPWGVDGAVLGEHAFLLRFFAANQDAAEDERLLLVNLGRDQLLTTMPEPLLAPPLRTHGWTLIFSSNEPRYGGTGVQPVPDTGALPVAGECALLFRAARR